MSDKRYSRDQSIEVAEAMELWEAARNLLTVIDRFGGVTKHAKVVHRLREVLDLKTESEDTL